METTTIDAPNTFSNSIKNVINGYFKQKPAMNEQTNFNDDENFIMSDEEKEKSSEEITMQACHGFKSRREYLLSRRNIRNNANLETPSVNLQKLEPQTTSSK